MQKEAEWPQDGTSSAWREILLGVRSRRGSEHQPSLLPVLTNPKGTGARRRDFISVAVCKLGRCSFGQKPKVCSDERKARPPLIQKVLAQVSN